METRKSAKMLEFRQQLNEKGCKLTGQRLAVMEAVLNNKGRYLSCEEIFELVSRSHPGIGLATVYRTLLLLEQLELVTKIYLDEGCARYGLCDLEEKVRYHFICMRCGAVYDVEENLLEIQNKQILKDNHFDIKSYIVKFYGYCSNCKLENKGKI